MAGERQVFCGKFRFLCTMSVCFAVVAVCGPIDDIVDQVSQPSYTYYLSEPNFLYTHDGNNRGYGQVEKGYALNNIVDTFTSFGLTTTVESGVLDGRGYWNAVALMPGLVTPNVMYVVGAHYDSAQNPGADDDASGVAGVLEAARVLSQYAFECTLVFIAFDAEEVGLIGSRGYVQAHSGDDIRGMISMDMVAWNNPLNPDTARIFGRDGSAAVKEALAQALLSYGGITASIGGQLDLSDHAPFEWAGFQACLLIEDQGNPYYHQQTDSVDTLNYIDYAYGTSMTRGVVGYLATAAVLVQGETEIPEPNCALLIVVAVILRLGRFRRAQRPAG